MQVVEMRPLQLIPAVGWNAIFNYAPDGGASGQRDLRVFPLASFALVQESWVETAEDGTEFHDETQSIVGIVAQGFGLTPADSFGNFVGYLPPNASLDDKESWWPVDVSPISTS